MNCQPYLWGAVGVMKDGKLIWANPGDTSYIIVGFVATAFYDGKCWIRIPERG